MTTKNPIKALELLNGGKYAGHPQRARLVCRVCEAALRRGMASQVRWHGRKTSTIHIVLSTNVVSRLVAVGLGYYSSIRFCLRSHANQAQSRSEGRTCSRNQRFNIRVTTYSAGDAAWELIRIAAKQLGICCNTQLVARRCGIPKKCASWTGTFMAKSRRGEHRGSRRRRRGRQIRINYSSHSILDDGSGTVLC